MGEKYWFVCGCWVNLMAAERKKRTVLWRSWSVPAVTLLSFTVTVSTIYSDLRTNELIIKSLIRQFA